MKRRILSLMILICSALLFAETGYKDYQWFSAPDEPNKNLTDEEIEFLTKFQKAQLTISKKQQSILGNKTDVFFFYFDNMLTGITYKTSNKNAKTLNKKFSVKVDSDKTKALDVFKLNEEMQKDLFPQIYAFLLMNQKRSNNSSYEELKKVLNSKENCKISIYDYNSDTRVAILENFTSGETYVVYTPYAQDY